MTPKQNITIKQARKTLGHKADNLSDKQIAIMLDSLYALAVRTIQTTIK